jgi:hypothetical protein
MARFTFPEWTQVFHKWVLLLVAGAPVVIGALIYFGVSPQAIRIGYQPTQPVPYSHALHVGELGLDCRYCHNTVERASTAAVPPAAFCMNCHTSIRKDSKDLLPIREAFADVKPVEWVRVHDLPDYVYFNHSAHVTRGVGCESCHGRIDLMDKVYQVSPLTMQWCLDCHNAPGQNVRPLEEITTMGYEPAERELIGARIVKEKKLNPPINCSTCHR